MKNQMILIETTTGGEKAVSVGRVAEMKLDSILRRKVQGEAVGEYETFTAKELNLSLFLDNTLTVRIEPAENVKYTPSVCFEQEGGSSMHEPVSDPDILEGAKHLFSIHHSPTVIITGYEKDDYPFRISTEQLFEDWKNAGFPVVWKRSDNMSEEKEFEKSCGNCKLQLNCPSDADDADSCEDYTYCEW